MHRALHVKGSVKRTVYTMLWFGRAFAAFGMILLLLGGVVACTTERPPQVLQIFAAASLENVFQRMSTEFERRHPGVEVRLHAAGSQALRLQLSLGARADVLAGVGPEERDAAEQAGLIAGAVAFAGNRVALVVPASNPARIRALEDLDRPHRLVLGAPAVPVGMYARQLLMRASTLHGIGFGERVLSHLVSEEASVSAVLLKVQLGEADAGFVYRTDVLAAQRAGDPVLEIPLPTTIVPVVDAWVAPVIAEHGAAEESADGEGRTRAALAQQWVDFLVSPEGKAILDEYGFQ